MPVLATSKTRSGRVWTHVSNDRPFVGHAPPVVSFVYPPDRTGARPDGIVPGMPGNAVGCLCRLLAASPRPRASRFDHRGRLLGACKAQVLRDCAAESTRRSQPK
ncbi:hypothetical protein ACQR0V_25810 [Bradyrhizobium sp. HKCCYLS2058]|uniref:hypothetical protein n=1 Tax=unclassified Bradyrhizobium TaxID=2631580 RepID=UPI003EC00E3C